MGDAQFDGGGSVKWKIRHSKGDHGHGNPNGGNGKDKDPLDGSGGKFRVFRNEQGVETEMIPLNTVEGNYIRIVWGPESPPESSSS